MQYSSIQAFNKQVSLVQRNPKSKRQKTKLSRENVIPHLQVNKWSTERDSKKNHCQPQNFIFLPDVVREHLWHMPISHLRINIKCKYSSLKSVYRDCSRDFTSFVTDVVLLLPWFSLLFQNSSLVISHQVPMLLKAQFPEQNDLSWISSQSKWSKVLLHF